MEEKIKALREAMEQAIAGVDTKEKLAAFWQDFLGKKGSIAELMKGLGAVAKEDRPSVGKVINEFKVQVEEQYRTLSDKIEQMELAAKNRKEQVDITLPGKAHPLGGLHPLTLVKNENNAFPLQVKPGEKTLIIFADSCASRAGTGDLARQLLEEKQALPDGAEIVVMKNTKDNGDICVLAALGADHVILVHRVYDQACLDPATEDGFSSGTFDKVIDALHKKGKTAIVVSCQLPYDAARFPEADAILLTYWGSTMRELPAEGSSWSANLPAGLLSCFGLGEAKGVLPVNIPALDETYQPTDEILWKRGQSKRP